MRSPLTVGELRKLLDGQPDDALVLVDGASCPGVTVSVKSGRKAGRGVVLDIQERDEKAQIGYCAIQTHKSRIGFGVDTRPS